VEFAKRLAKQMKIDFDVIVPTDNSEDFGYKTPDGNWTGLIGRPMGDRGFVFIPKINTKPRSPGQMVHFLTKNTYFGIPNLKWYISLPKIPILV
jgi:hypothetical protein